MILDHLEKSATYDNKYHAHLHTDDRVTVISAIAAAGGHMSRAASLAEIAGFPNLTEVLKRKALEFSFVWNEERKEQY